MLGKKDKSMQDESELEEKVSWGHRQNASSSLSTFLSFTEVLSSFCQFFLAMAP